MNEKEKKKIFYAIVALALIILIGVGSTFAFFSASVASNENAVGATAAVFEIGFKDDTSLIKGNIIPSEERFVDIASKRVDSEGNFLKPVLNEETNEWETKDTACIDDLGHEICSMYTFTITNPMDDVDLPLYIYLDVSMNNFENLYYKVLDKDLNEVISATKLVDDRPYTEDAEGNKTYEEGSKISPVIFTNINKTLPKSPDENNLSSVRYTIVLWIMENNEIQNDTDGGKVFASTLKVEASGTDGKGITGVFTTGGNE